MKLYRTRTQEEYDWLARELDKKGMVSYIPRYEQGGDIVIYVDEKEDYLSYSDLDYAEEKHPNEPIIEVSDLMKTTDHDYLMDKVLERNNKPEQENNGDEVNRPTHYKNGNKDLFDELYERLYHDERLYTGREVFITVMRFVAERYIRRYPNKNEEDLQKGIYTLERLKEYEELEEEDAKN